MHVKNSNNTSQSLKQTNWEMNNLNTDSQLWSSQQFDVNLAIHWSVVFTEVYHLHLQWVSAIPIVSLHQHDETVSNMLHLLMKWSQFLFRCTSSVLLYVRHSQCLDTSRHKFVNRIHLLLLVRFFNSRRFVYFLWKKNMVPVWSDGKCSSHCQFAHAVPLQNLSVTIL